MKLSDHVKLTAPAETVARASRGALHRLNEFLPMPPKFPGMTTNMGDAVADLTGANGWSGAADWFAECARWLSRKKRKLDPCGYDPWLQGQQQIAARHALRDTNPGTYDRRH